MRTYQKVYAASASDAAVNNLIMWTSPIWLPIVLIVLPVFSWATAEKPYCVDLEASHQKKVVEMYAAYNKGYYDTFEYYQKEAKKMQKQLQSGKCKKTPTL